MVHGQVTEQLPKAYTQEDKQAVQATFTRQGSDQYAITAQYDTRKTLVVDPLPALGWGTYYGGGGDDNISQITTDAQGNFIVAGTTQSFNGISTPGTFKSVYTTTLSGGSKNDFFIAKISSDLTTRYWGTYYGGLDEEFSPALQVSPDGDIFLAGLSRSVDGMSTPDALYLYGDSTGNYLRSFVAKLDSNGTDRYWGTYFGGYTNSMLIDASENVYISGSAHGVNYPIETSANAFSGTFGGGDYDGFIAKLCSYPLPFYTPLAPAFCESTTITLSSQDPNAIFYRNGLPIANNIYQPNPDYSSQSIGTPRYDTIVHVGEQVGCTQVIDTLYIRIYPTRTGNYIGNFETDNDGWFTLGVDSLHGGNIIDTLWKRVYMLDSYQFSTMDLSSHPFYAANDQGVVYGPCFDLSSIPAPFISFDFWSFSRAGIDGVRMEQFDPNTLAWESILGGGLGINWNIDDAVAAWGFGESWAGESGYTGGMAKTYRLLNDFHQRKDFWPRFHFKSADFPIAGNYPGFGFDNIYIGNRDKQILVEAFTNTAQDQIPLYQALDSEDFLYVQYHNNDFIFNQNSYDVNARQVFYGINQSVVDGNIYNGDTYSGGLVVWQMTDVADYARYAPVDFNIHLDSIYLDGNDFKLRTTIYPVQFDPASQQVALFVAVVDTFVSDTFRNVFLDFLPDASGTLLTQNNATGFDYQWAIPAHVGGAGVMGSGKMSANACFSEIFNPSFLSFFSLFLMVQ